MNTAQTPMYEWKDFPWRKIERDVFKLQKRIYQASLSNGTHEKSLSVEEPDEVKVSRPVFKTSQSGD